MADFMRFASENPYLTFFLAWFTLHYGVKLVAIVVRQPFLMWNRWLRSRNIAAHGWPPAHCDADGDFRPSPPPTEDV